MGGGEHDHGRRNAFLPGRGDADGGVRVGENAGLLEETANSDLGLVLAHRMGDEKMAQLVKLGSLQMKRPCGAELGHEPRHPLGFAPADLEQEALEIARKLNVHARAGSGNHAPRLENPRRENARQTVIEVRGNNEARDRQAHAARRVTCENITEIPGGHGERHRPIGRAQRHRGGEVIDDLGEDAGPVDGVDAGEIEAVAKAHVAEQRLHQSLAVVEGAFDGDVVHVALHRRGHLPPLHVAHPAFRVQDEDVDGVEPTKGFNGGGAGIAGGGADHRGAAAVALQRAVHQPRHHLHGQVLEGERRPMEQLEQPRARCDLPQRRHGGMVEAGISLFQHGFEVGESRVVRKIRRHHLIGGLGIIEAGKSGDGISVELRPGLRHVQPAVAGKAGQKRPFEEKRRRLTPCADISQSVNPWG